MQLQWTQTEERWRTDETFVEDVSLVSAVAGPGEQALALSQSAQGLDQGDPLEALQARIWTAEADAWRRLADNNRAQYTVTLYPSPGAPIVRTWSLDPGDAVTMTAEAIHYHFWPFVVGGGVLFFLFLVISWSAWRNRPLPESQR